MCRPVIEKLVIRDAGPADLTELLALYAHLHGEDTIQTPAIQAAWAAILADHNHHLLVGCLGGALVCSCAAVAVPNLSRGGRPYMLIENVVTLPAWRGRGFASALLAQATNLASQCNCYKVMLLTGRKESATLRFYEKAGFNSRDKRAFIRWL